MPETKAGNDSPASETMRASQSTKPSRRCAATTPERHADDAADEQRRERQLDRVGQHRGDVGRDRTVGDERAAEIASRDLDHELAVLDEERLVEAEPLAQRLARRRARLVAEHDDGRIARHDPHQDEHERQHRPQRRQRKQQPVGDEAQHRLSRAVIPPPCGEGRLARSASGVGVAGVERRGADAERCTKLRRPCRGSVPDATPRPPAPPRKGEGIAGRRHCAPHFFVVASVITGPRWIASVSL